MANSGNGSADGGQVGMGRIGWRRKRQLGNRVECSVILASTMKLPLQIQLYDFHIAQGHVYIFVAKHLHEGRQANAETYHFRGIGMTKTVLGHLAGTTRVLSSLCQGATEHVVHGMTSPAAR